VSRCVSERQGEFGRGLEEEFAWGGKRTEREGKADSEGEVKEPEGEGVGVLEGTWRVGLKENVSRTIGNKGRGARGGGGEGEGETHVIQ